MDVVGTVKSSKMRPYQWLIIFLCMFCNMVDGFDFFAMGFVLPHLPEGFATPSVKGYLISAGLVGMACGAMFVAPLADRYGRRPLIIAGLTTNILAMILTALAPNASTMLAGRFLTGIGVGVISATMIVVAQEFSSVARRNFAVGIVTVGFPLGSTLAGLTGVSILALFDGAWQAMFWVGMIVSAAGLILVSSLLPETLSFLVASDTPKSHIKIGRIAARLGIPYERQSKEWRSVSADDSSSSSSSTREGVLSPQLRERTLLLWIGYTFLTAAYYFVGTWTPQLIADASGSAQEGAVAGTIISVGSLAGSIVFGVIGLKFLATRIAWVALSLAVVSLVLFTITMQGPLALVMAGALGLAVFVSVSSFTAMAPPMYPVTVRARGYGLMVGISRIGAVVTPILAGYAAGSFSANSIFLAASVPLIISAVAAFRLWSVTRNDFDREFADAAVAARRALTRPETTVAPTKRA
ncbi:MFS transporter [Rhodococcus sp. YH3-3]|uniref:MFS transporter n=1 Tax=Rhodococcus sp. YH3-3 TaxID=1803579 RepID=UPI000A67C51E|nr:MFS transporter [Rhodococcus sp. YH3-3]